jgi:hypothetical protein
VVSEELSSGGLHEVDRLRRLICLSGFASTNESRPSTLVRRKGLRPESTTPRPLIETSLEVEFKKNREKRTPAVRDTCVGGDKSASTGHRRKRNELHSNTDDVHSYPHRTGDFGALLFFVVCFFPLPRSRLNSQLHCDMTSQHRAKARS